jgi:nucleoside-diphosphate-sugar epimerase
MDVVVTGGSGTIGSFVTSECVQRGHDVTVFDVEEPDASAARYVDGDITRPEDVEAAVADADAVVHMVSLLPPACRSDPRRAERINVGGTLNVLEAVADGTRVITVSSKAVFGPITGMHAHPDFEPLGEDAPKAPTTVYGVTKLACERYAAQYKRRGVDVAAVRFASTYGPGKGERHGNRSLVPRAIERAAGGEDVRLPGGDQRNDLVYFGDVANGIADAVETDRLGHLAYHLGSGRAPSIRDFGEALADVTGASVAVDGGLNYRDADTETYCLFDISRARADLGYEPAFSLRDGIRDYLGHLGT